MRDVRSLALAVLVATCWLSASASADPRALPGWTLYDRYCLACHGTLGDGQGPAAPFNWGVPRSFAAADYKWRSTPLGQPPTDDDLRTTIRFGAPGSSMPAFDGLLAPADLDSVIDVVKAFAPAAFTRTTKTPVAVAIPAMPAEFAPDRGKQLYAKNGCPACHGDDGKGDGPAMKVSPYDFTALGLRRPRAADDRDARRRAAAESLATGLAGTAMPAYAGQLADADLWAIADFVVRESERGARTYNGTLDKAQINADRAARTAVGAWLGVGDPDEDALWKEPIKPQGAAPASLAPAEASLRSRQCGRCHAKQVREWSQSLHSATASPGLRAQIDVMQANATATCKRCHTPLAEQDPLAAAFDGDLRDEGVTCAACHVRDWTRRGPDRVSSSLTPDPSYPLKTLAIYERADFCMGCHQLPARTAVEGKPLLNTYKEWLDGPYMRRGIECQHCHMPNREHTFLGVHDRDTFRQGIVLAVTSARSKGSVTVTATLTNAGAGHMLPTTPTPAAWITVELLDAKGNAIVSQSEMRIGRDISWDGTAWHEREDTRIPPGESRALTRTWKVNAASAHVQVEVHPDDYYEHFYEARLKLEISDAERQQYEAALQRARASYYVAEDKIVPL